MGFLHFELKNLLFFLAFSLFPLFTMAHYTPVVISDDFERERVGKYMTYYIEKEGEKLSIEEIVKKQFDTLVYKNAILNFTFTNSSLPIPTKVIWLRLDVRTQYPDSTKKFLLEIKSPLLDQIEFYHFQNGQWQGQVTGGHYPVRKRMFEHRTFLFDIQNGTNAQHTYFLKITTSDLMIVYPILYESNVFIKYTMSEQVAFGIFYGLLIALFGFNLIEWWHTKKNFLYLLFLCLILIGTLMLIRMNGFSYIYFWVGNHWWENRAFPIAINLFSMLLIAFGLRFFSISHQKIVSKILKINLLLSILFLIITFIYPTFEVNALTIITAILCVCKTFIIGIYETLKGEQENKFFVTGAYLFFIGILLSFFRFFDIIETGSLLGSYGIEIGFLAFVILTSVSLKLRKSYQNAQ
ncbi:7TMR-DISM family protein [Thermoflexibacter ruber]|uniref:7TMR-DISM extracellular 2 n=1 Tax=Thermoflexibacter ruber TaxID=1003 RepID=A0A1I2H412_9BACT|nr:7TM diverse intracellular signaling domain-containing protein [Thermoflexibacter ruber]SFF24133.1 7TMR-DISM extracellular 2 [Thermoflexibacter ruber]